MKNYRIELKCAGPITQPADSQKIFGALVTKLSKEKGAEEASRLVKAVKDGQIHFALSNLMPLGYLPVPQDYIVGKLADDESLKELRSEIKKRAYVRLCDLETTLDDPRQAVSKYPYIKISDGQQLRASLESNQYGFDGMEAKLFTVPVSVLQEIKEKEEKGKPVSEFCFYLQTDNEQALSCILDIAESLIRSEIPLILGKRSSQGLNKYYITHLEKIILPKYDSNKYLNLGMLLPDKIDYKTSVLKLFTSERRPFSMSGGWNQTFQKKFISFIDCGSVISLEDGIKHAGKCVESPFIQNRDIVFGNAFLYPISLKGDTK